MSLELPEIITFTFSVRTDVSIDDAIYVLEHLEDALEIRKPKKGHYLYCRSTPYVYERLANTKMIVKECAYGLSEFHTTMSHKYWACTTKPELSFILKKYFKEITEMGSHAHRN